MKVIPCETGPLALASDSPLPINNVSENSHQLDTSIDVNFKPPISPKRKVTPSLT